MRRQNVSLSPNYTYYYIWRKDTTIIMPRQKKSPRDCKSFPFFGFCPTYLVSFFSKNFLYLLLNLSTRPALSTSFILPV